MRLENLKNSVWIVFSLVGLSFIYWGIHQLFIIPGFDPEHWAWLTTDPEIIGYIKFWFRIQGLWTVANGLFITVVASTGFRWGERWAGWTLAYVPVHILLLTTQMYWLFIFTIPIALLLAWTLWISRGHLQLPQMNRRGYGWIGLFAIGLSLLFYAYDNFFAIPALDVHDPDRGWAWLTTVPEVIDYIKFYFRIFGVRVLAFAMMVLVTVVAGLRRGYRRAWRALLIVPILAAVHIIFWPWLVPLLIGLLLFVCLSLWLAHPRTMAADP
ncbi:MAG: hypothetical protein R3300_19425 [Candidatus Promineifilaceae bacterium]|nr:hypothetical protein [Candidatus Promineifilaceae bacterium]